MKKFICTLLIILHSITAMADDNIDFIHPYDNIKSIFNRNYEKNEFKYSKQEYLKLLKKWNPKIKDWVNPPAMELIFTDYPYSPYVSDAPPPTLPRLDDRQVSINAIYSISSGAYTNTYNGNIIKSTQNFPLTLGVSTLLKDVSLKHSFSGSIYGAQASKATVDQTSVKVPFEYGATAYYQRNFPLKFRSFYGGLDFESLNLIDSKEFDENLNVKIKNINIIYGTVGIVQSFYFDSFKLSIKGSFSNSLNPTTSGYKALLYNSVTPNNSPFSYHLFYKIHELNNTGAEVSIHRFGLSIGWSIK